MYLQSTLCVKVYDKITNTLKPVAVVRKGDVLSPNVFEHSINDLTAYIYSSLDPVYLIDKRLNCLMYADDVILLPLVL